MGNFPESREERYRTGYLFRMKRATPGKHVRAPSLVQGVPRATGIFLWATLYLGDSRRISRLQPGGCGLRDNAHTHATQTRTHTHGIPRFSASPITRVADSIFATRRGACPDPSSRFRDPLEVQRRIHASRHRDTEGGKEERREMEGNTTILSGVARGARGE